MNVNGFTNILKKVCLAISALVALELLARLAAVAIPATPPEVRMIDPGTNHYSRPSVHVGYERQTNWSGRVLFTAERTFDANGFYPVDGQQIQNPALKKIMLLGDSCTFGVGQPVEDTYGELVDEELSDYAVINLAMPGYSSYQCLQMLRMHVDELDPALIVVASSYNDRRYVLRKSMMDGADKFTRAYKRHKRTSRVYKYLVSARWLGVLYRTFLPPKQTYVRSVDDLFPRVRPQAYRANLEAMAEEARKRSIPVVFIALSDNPIWTDYLDRGIENLEDGNVDLAIINLGAVAATPTPFTPLGKRYLAKAYLQKGQLAEADQALLYECKDDSSNGQVPIELDDHYTAIMRDVAQRWDAGFIDAGAEMQQSPEVYIDACHFGRKGHKIVAVELLEYLEEHKPAR